MIMQFIVKDVCFLKRDIHFLMSSLLVLLLAVHGSIGENPVDKENLTFKPTHEWQKVQEGQAIPKGLHVRINLQTGEKEAKFMDENEDDKKSLIEAPEFNKETNQDHLNLEPEELKKIMKKIRADDSDEHSKSNFRSYEQLKKDFNDLNMIVKTDIEIISKLIENFKNFHIFKSSKDLKNSDHDVDDEEILTTLVDLEYLVHQYDNALEFAKLNGFTEVIYKSLNSSNGEIKSEALRLHGSATQSNPKVQISALDAGSIYLLLKILSFEDDINVRSRSLYALSCLLRRFPAAQHKLLTDGGLSVFAKIFDEEKSDLLKLQIRIITLIHDLLFERKDAKMNILEEERKNLSNSEINILKERLQQYEKMNLEKKLVEQDWCKRIPKWFLSQNHVRDVDDVKNDIHSAVSPDHPIRDQHDIIEKVVDTLFALSDICKTQFLNNKELLHLLKNLEHIYSELAAKELDNKDITGQFYNSLANVLQMLTKKLSIPNAKKDEL